MGKNKKTKSIRQPPMIEDVLIKYGDTCGDCRFWLEPKIHKQKGICRRYPNLETIYREPSQWCGEYVQKKN